MIELDGTKIAWYADRVQAWQRGEHIAPVTIDMALTTSCNFRCVYCYKTLQKNETHRIEKDHITSFLNDCAEIGVKGVSLVSDGESTISPHFKYFVELAHSLGLSVACGTNGYLMGDSLLDDILHCFTYLRFNISAAEERRYNEIMGTSKDEFSTVLRNVESAVRHNRVGDKHCTIGLQMVLMPSFADQILPLAKLAIELGVDYLLIKHCSDDEFGTLGVNYDSYLRLYPILEEAEALSTEKTKIVVKWSKIKDGNKRSYQRCYGPPFILQISGTGLVAPCGMLFHSRYRRDFHIGNITQVRFNEIWKSKRYWEVMNRLASSEFNAQRMCGSLCLQHATNKALDAHIKGTKKIEPATESLPEHGAFL